MCFRRLFHRKKKDEFEKKPKIYIETLFRFLDDKGFEKNCGQVNGESWVGYTKGEFHITINYLYNGKEVWFDIYNETWDNEPFIKHLDIKDERYELRFEHYDNLSCKEKLHLVADYLSEYSDVVERKCLQKSN